MPPCVPCPRVRHENVKDTCFLRVLGQDTAIFVSDTAKKRVPISARRVPKTGHGFHVFFSRLVYKMIFSLDFYHLFCLVWGLEWFVQEEKEGFHCPSHWMPLQVDSRWISVGRLEGIGDTVHGSLLWLLPTAQEFKDYFLSNSKSRLCLITLLQTCKCLFHCDLIFISRCMLNC